VNRVASCENWARREDDRFRYCLWVVVVEGFLPGGGVRISVADVLANVLVVALSIYWEENEKMLTKVEVWQQCWIYILSIRFKELYG